MPTEVYTGSASINTAWSLPRNAAAGAVVTDDETLMWDIDFSAMGAGDSYEVRATEKITSGGSALLLHHVVVPPGMNVVSIPFRAYMHGWDVQVTKLAGTTRTIGWSARRP